jgi:pheromone shutdown-related protein TraB
MPESKADEPVRDIERDGAHFTLLGTAHVSRASAEAVETMLAESDYDLVAVELCDSRYQALTNPDQLLEVDMFRVIRDGRGGVMLAQLALGGYQRRLAEQFGIEPGAEMRAAIDTARAQGRRLVLIARDVGITLKRASRSLGWWQRWVLLNGLFLGLFTREELTEDDIEQLKQGDMLTGAFTEFAAEAPALFQALIAERDDYMAAELRRNAAPGQRVLAVVGAGHLDGIARALAEDERDPETVCRELNRIPPGTRWPRYIPWIVAALVLTGFAWGFTRSTELGLRVMGDWILINGGLSALGAALAGGHPVTVLSGFLAAPITSLNPTIGAGMATAAVETVVRKPRMADFAALRDDTARLRGWWHNRVARTLLVFAFSSLGSALGTWLAGATILSRLF